MFRVMAAILLLSATAWSQPSGRPAEKPDLPESPGRADIQAAMSKVKPKLVACGQQHGVKGTVKIAIKIGPEGTVKSAEIKQSPDDKVDACIVGVAKTITLPRSISGVTFSYPIVL